MIHLHRAYDLIFALPFTCDELARADPDAPPDVIVRETAVPRTLADATVREESYELSPTAYLQHGGARGGRFLVENGDTISFERGPACDEGLLRHLLLHHVMAALLRQRNLLVLHASGAVLPRGVAVVCGDSGAGKSTTVAALTRLGWPLHTDDVSVLRPVGDGSLEMPAGGHHVHLFEQSSAALALDTDGLARREWHRMKMAVPTPVAESRPARTVWRIVRLEMAVDGPLRVERITGRDKLPVLMESLYGPYLPETILARTALVSQALQAIDMMRIVRPAGAWTMEAVLAAILAE